MAYSSTNPPYLLVPRAAGGAGALWGYLSTADSLATIAGSGYFTNGHALGMKVRDFVLAAGATSSTAIGPVGFVTTVTASSAATVSFATTST